MSYSFARRVAALTAVTVVGVTTATVSPAMAATRLDIPSVSRACASDHAKLGTAWAAFNPKVDAETAIFRKQVAAKKKTYRSVVRTATKQHHSALAAAKRMNPTKTRTAVQRADDAFDKAIDKATTKTNERLDSISDRAKECEAHARTRDAAIAAANTRFDNQMGERDNGARAVLTLDRDRARAAHSARIITVNDTYGYCMIAAGSDPAAKQACRTERDEAELDSERRLQQDLRTADEVYAAKEIAATAERAAVTGR